MKGGTDLNIRFFICNHCGNIIALIKDCGVPVYCCGQNMNEINYESGNGAQEKHIPVYKISGNSVTVFVGETEHPMTPEHYIEWVCIESDQGMQLKKLKQNSSPEISFSISEGEKIKAVYALCNQHSLWKA